MNFPLASLLSQWANTSPIIRWGLVLALCLVVLYPLAFIWDERQVQQQQVAEWLEKISKIQSSSTKNTASLQTQIAELDKQRVTLEERFWEANEAGVAEVDIRNWLEGLIVSHALADTQVRLETSELKDKDSDYPHWTVVATIAGQTGVKQILPLIRELEESPHFFDFTQTVLTQESFDLTLHIPVLKGKV
jgi:hypothetical protein